MSRDFIFVLILLISQTAFCIDHQKEIETAQAWANSFERPYPIFIFDRDEINFLYASKNLLGESNKKKRLEFLKSYLEEKTNTTLSKNNLDNIDVYLTQVTGTAVAQLSSQSYTDISEFQFCSVFALPPNGNAQIETERLTGLNFKEVFPQESYPQLTKKMTLKQIYLFSLYHEVSHCLDPHYLPEAYGSPEDSHAVHLTEAFAEVMAYLGLYHRLDREVAEARALYRSLYSRKMGEYFAQESPGGFFNPHRSSGGVIYYLTPYLMDIYQKLRFKEIDLSTHSPNDLIDLAIAIVEENQLKSREFSAIRMGLTEGFEKVLVHYGELSYKDPELFYTAFLKLQAYKAETDLWVSEAFGVKTPDTVHSDIAPVLPVDALCGAIATQSQDLFDQNIEKLRQFLNRDDIHAESARQLSSQLNNLPAILEKECSEK